MAVLTLEEIKQHLRMELDDDSRDAELLSLEAAAVDHLALERLLHALHADEPVANQE